MGTSATLQALRERIAAQRTLDLPPRTVTKPRTPTRYVPKPGSLFDRVLSVIREHGEIAVYVLVVECWHRWPQAFGFTDGLMGHPSDKKVESCLFGKGRLIDRGLVEWVRPGVLRAR
jgi:hypothetical protein